MTLYADISSFQGAIDWQKYAVWAKSFDGTARVAMKATEGTGFTDARFAANRAGSLAAGVDSILYYHYARPDLNAATAEADWLHSVVGLIRAQDLFMLDYEQGTPLATAQWALDFLARLESLSGKTPLLYASVSFIQAHLQDARLAHFPLILAEWTGDPSARPACPAPWTAYLAVQYTDKANIPGIQCPVDANVFLGGTTTNTSYELAGFPMISQRDGDPNQNYDCVPASIAACMQWLLGTHFAAAEIKDAVYGADYVGGTAASAYVAYCAAHGVTLAPVNGNDGQALVTALRAALAAQHPCLITEPDPYAAGWTHVCAAYRCDATNITVMDPWIDAPVTKTDAQWAAQLQDNQIWTVEKNMQRYSIASTDFGAYFTDSDADHWTCKKTGKIVQFGIKAFYQSLSIDGNSLPVIGLPTTNEIYIPLSTGKQIVLQVFERAGVYYDPAHLKDHQPGAGDYSLCHLTDSDFVKNVPGLMPIVLPAANRDTALIAAINAIADGIAPLVAQALVEAGKL